MAFSSLKVLLVAAAAIGANLEFSQNAEALELGCSSMAQLNQNLIKEGQHSVVMANLPLAGGTLPSANDSGYEAIAFLMNEGGTEGYAITNDTDLDGTPTKGCVIAKLRNGEVYDARKSGVDPATRINGNRQVASEQCARKPADIGVGCAYHNDVLEAGDRNGMRVMFQATVTSSNDRTLPVNTILTISGIVNGSRLGALGDSTREGNLTMLTPLKDIFYRPYGLERIQK